MISRAGIGSLAGIALGLGIVFVGPDTIFPLPVMRAGFGLIDIMFHEIGHSLTAWLFGTPSIPSIFTLFGADQAGGLAYHFGRFWVLQIIVYAAMGYGLWRLYNAGAMRAFGVAGIMAAIIVILSLTKYHESAIYFMGHGSAVIVGCFFLVRALLGTVRNGIELFLNASIGTFMLGHNALFFFRIATDEDVRREYSSKTIFGMTHHDLFEIAHNSPVWTVQGVGWFGVMYTVAVVAAGVFIALRVCRADESDAL